MVAVVAIGITFLITVSRLLFDGLTGTGARLMAAVDVLLQLHAGGEEGLTVGTLEGFAINGLVAVAAVDGQVRQCRKLHLAHVALIGGLGAVVLVHLVLVLVHLTDETELLPADVALHKLLECVDLAVGLKRPLAPEHLGALVAGVALREVGVRAAVLQQVLFAINFALADVAFVKARLVFVQAPDVGLKSVSAGEGQVTEGAGVDPGFGVVHAPFRLLHGGRFQRAELLLNQLQVLHSVQSQVPLLHPLLLLLLSFPGLWMPPLLLQQRQQLLIQPHLQALVVPVAPQMGDVAAAREELHAANLTLAVLLSEVHLAVLVQRFLLREGAAANLAGEGPHGAVRLLVLPELHGANKHLPAVSAGQELCRCSLLQAVAESPIIKH